MAVLFAEKVLSAVASVKHIPRERISLESSLEELGFDSLDKIVMLFELEKQFQVSISDDAVRSVRSVSDVVEGAAKLVANTPFPSVTPEAHCSPRGEWPSQAWG